MKLLRQLGGWLRSSHSFKESVIAHQSSSFAPKIYGAKPITEATGYVPTCWNVAVGERSYRDEG